MTDPLAPFLASIAHLGPAEARKAKLLYLRNALVSYSVYVEDARTFSFMQLGFAIIPVFWPLFYAQRRSIIGGARKQRARIESALERWAAELGDDGLVLQRELAMLAANEPGFFPWSKKQPAQLGA